MMQMNPFMKQLLAAKPAVQSMQPQGNPQPAAPRQPGGLFLPQQGVQGMNLRPPMGFAQAQQSPIPVPPVTGPSIQQQLQQLDPRNIGDWTIDPTNPEQLLQYKGRF